MIGSVATRAVLAAIAIGAMAASAPSAGAAPRATFERFIQIFDPVPGSFAGKVRSPNAHCYSKATVRVVQQSKGKNPKIIRSLGKVSTDRRGHWRLVNEAAGLPGRYLFSVKESSFRAKGGIYLCRRGSLEVQIDPGALP